MKAQNRKKVNNKNNKEATEGAIVVTSENLCNVLNWSDCSILAALAGMNESNVWHMLHGDNNFQIETFERFFEKVGYRAIISLLPDTDELKDFLKDYGHKEQHFWTVPDSGNPLSLDKVLMKMNGGEAMPPTMGLTMFDFHSAVCALCKIKGLNFENLKTEIVNFKIHLLKKYLFHEDN